MEQAAQPQPDRSGMRTTELWGKVIVQIVLLLNTLFGLGIEIDDQVAMAIVGMMESAYAISRSIAKRPHMLPAGAAISAEQLSAAIAEALRAQNTHSVQLSTMPSDGTKPIPESKVNP